MHNGRNAKNKKRIAIASFVLLAGAAFLAPAAGALSLLGSGAGDASSLLSGAASGGGSGGSSQAAAPSQSASADQGLAGSAQTTAQAAAGAEVTPPNPQPVLDEAASAAAQAKGIVEAQAAMASAQKGNLAGAAAAKWGLKGSGDGAYDVVLGGDYDTGVKGLMVAHADKGVRQHVDVHGATGAAADAKDQAKGAVDMLLGQFGDLYSKLHGSFYVGVDSAAKALGEVGMDIGGIFGFNHAAQVANLDNMDLDQRIDWAAPALPAPDLHVPLPDVPTVAVDQGGEVAADAAATAQGIVHG